MREFHVVFMYYLLPLVWRFPEHLTDAHDLVSATKADKPTNDLVNGGEALLAAIKPLLRGLHLTKGFTSQVCWNHYPYTQLVHPCNLAIVILFFLAPHGDNFNNCE